MQLNSVGSNTRPGQQGGQQRNGGSLLSRLLHGGSGRQAQQGGQQPGGNGSQGPQPRNVAAQAQTATTTVTTAAQQSSFERKHEQEAAVQTPIDLGYPRNLEEHYELGPQLGKGGNGVVRLVKDRATGVEYACKSIQKVLKAGPHVTDRKRANHLSSLKQEIAVLKRLKGSLNIIDLEGVFEDDECVHLVMELCTGGELSFAIGQRHYSERTVASFMRAVLRTLAQCHAQHILHRDIKPGNFMLLNGNERAPLRAIDFGLATPFEPQDLPLTNLGLEGTPWFQAPEVLSSSVTPAADVWSAGVMAVQLLTGRLPFDDHKNPMAPSITAIWRSILSDKVDFNSSVWAGISPEAKDFVARLLDRDPTKRPTARDALKHPWLAGDSRERSTGKQLQQSVVARIQRFAAVSEFKRNVLEMIAAEMLQQPALASSGECLGDQRGRPLVYDPAGACLQPLYRKLDFDANDEADVTQVSKALHDLGFQLSPAEVDRLLEQLDPGHTGKISRSAFAASQVDWRYLQVSHKEAWLALVRRVFAQLDTDSDGVLRADEIRARLEGAIPEEQHSELAQLVADAMTEAGQPGSEQAMDLNDFIRMLKVSSVDSLDMYDDRLAYTLGASASVDRLNTLLQRAGSLGSAAGSRHGGNLLRGAVGADDSHHSNTTGGDSSTHHLFGLDPSQHGDNSARYGGMWRFDSGGVGGGSAAGAAAGRLGGGGAGSAWRFDEEPARAPPAPALTPSTAPVQVPASAAPQWRFDVSAPRQTAPPAPAAPAWRFDVSAPAVLAPPAPRSSGASDSVLGWRFDVPTPAAPQAQPHAPQAALDNNSTGSRGVGGGWFDRRHHGSSLYKNSVVAGPCRTTSDWSVHGAHRMLSVGLEPVQE